MPSTAAAAPSPPHTARWRAVAPQGLAWHRWETGEYSLFDANSGETHLLSELPATLLQRLVASPCRLDALCAELATLCEVADDGAWQAKISTLLDGLAMMELIEADPAP